MFQRGGDFINLLFCLLHADFISAFWQPWNVERLKKNIHSRGFKPGVFCILLHTRKVKQYSFKMTTKRVGASDGIWNARASLNFIRLLRVFITPSVTSESTGRQCRPVTSLLLDLCFNSCKKQNTIFKWQTEKYRLEMSAWYRTALFFSIVIHV